MAFVGVLVVVSGVNSDMAVVAWGLGDWPGARRHHSSSSSGAMVVELHSSSATDCRSSSGAVVVALRSSSAMDRRSSSSGAVVVELRSSSSSVPADHRIHGDHGSRPMTTRG